MARERVQGTISSIGFDSGHRFVVGCWDESPIGRLVDVMWATPADHRILLAPHDEAADFVTSIYTFDEVRVGHLSVRSDGRETRVDGGDHHGLELAMRGGRRRAIPFRRPLAVTRWIERPIARALMGVETYGTSPTGSVEWYQASGWRWVEEAEGTLDGNDLGAMAPLWPPVGVGFSEPPRRPSIVSVAVTIERPALGHARSMTLDL